MDQRRCAVVPASRGAGAGVRTRLRDLGRGPRRRTAFGRRRAAVGARPRQRRGHPVALAAGGRGRPPLRGGVRPPRRGRRRGTGGSRPGGPQPDVVPAESTGVVAGGGGQAGDSGPAGGVGFCLDSRREYGCWGSGVNSGRGCGSFGSGSGGSWFGGEFASGDAGRGAGRFRLAGRRGVRGAGRARRACRGDSLGGDRHQRGSRRGPFGTAARDRFRAAAEGARGQHPARRQDRADLRRQPTPAYGTGSGAG